VVLERAEEGFSVNCPGLPGGWSQGATEQEALENIQSAIGEHLEAIRESLVGAGVWEVYSSSRRGVVKSG
jgi:predicted RNase H-like HicB family nuclease